MNNAGYGSFEALEDVPISEAKYQFEVNIFGLARLTQLVLPYMRKQQFGKIIFLPWEENLENHMVPGIMLPNLP